VNKTEVAKLLDEIAAVDNRKVGPEQVEAWHGVISQIPYDIAREALRMARKDERTTWLEPRHIVSWAKDAALRLDREAGRNIPPEPQGEFVKQPHCRAHGKALLTCYTCCDRMKHLADKPKSQILLYAREHII